MYVVKRNGKMERVQFDKITSRISKLSYGLNLNFVEPLVIAQKCVNGVYSGVKTSQLDTLAAETAVCCCCCAHTFDLIVGTGLPHDRTS